MSAADIQDALDALHHIPAELPREDWVRIGMAAKTSGIDFEDFDAWSAQAGNYDAAACRHTWHSFKDGKGIMTEWRFVDGKDALPSDEEVKKMRPAN